MKTDANIRRTIGEFRHQPLCGAHDELEMRNVVAILRSNHQKVILIGRPAMQTVSSIKHEDFERGDAVVEDEMLHFINVPGFDLRNVIAVIDPESSFRLIEDIGHEVAV